MLVPPLVPSLLLQLMLLLILLSPLFYTYQYGVSDDYSGANLQQTKSRDGYTISGSYSVGLLDERKPIVTYSHNGDGIVKDVTMMDFLNMDRLLSKLLAKLSWLLLQLLRIPSRLLI